MQYNNIKPQQAPADCANFEPQPHRLVKLTLSPEDRQQKPRSDAELIRENGLIHKRNTRELTLPELARMLTAPHSRTWCCSILSGNRNERNFESTELLALDFDKGWTPKQVLETAREHGLPPVLIYSSFSDDPHGERRFRAVWLLDQPIFDKKVAKECAHNLSAIFPGCDPRSKDLISMWFGGKEVLYAAWEDAGGVHGGQIALLLTTTIALEEAGLPYRLSEADAKNRSRSFQRHTLSGPTTEKSKNGRETGSSNDILIRSGQNPSEFDKNESPSDGITLDFIEIFDWEEAAQAVQMLSDFIAARRKIGHNELFWLAGNMAFISGGADLFRECIDKNSMINDEKKSIIDYVRYRFHTGSPIYPPGFGTLPADHPDRALSLHYRNLLHVRITKSQKAMYINDTRNLIPLATARQELHTKLKEVLSRSHHKITLFKVGVGVGKSHLISKLDLPNALYLLPTHQLIQQASKASTADHLCTPPLPTLPAHLKKEHDMLCRIGDYRAAKDLLKSYARNAAADPGVKKDILQYLKDLDTCSHSSKMVFTTHSRGLHAEFKNKDTLIIDEDCLAHILERATITTKDLRLLGGALGGSRDAVRITQIEHQIKAGIDIFCPSLSGFSGFSDDDKVRKAICRLGKKLSGDVYSFFNCRAFHAELHDPLDPQGDWDIHYIKDFRLPQDKNIIILSATAHEGFYRKLYGNRVEVVDISDIECKANLIQISEGTFSALKLQSSAELVQSINDFLPDLPAITFKKLKSVVKGAHPTLHFGNAAGDNSLKGKDLKIVGTPRMDATHYILIAKALRHVISPNTRNVAYQKVLCNGYLSYQTLSHDPVIRDIQLYFTGAELTQAIGRVRPYEHECNVFIFSEYPVPGARQFSMKDLPELAQRFGVSMPASEMAALPCAALSEEVEISPN